MEFIFDEQKYVSDLLKGGKFTTNKFGDFINKITRYNYFVRQLSDNENIEYTKMWLTVHCNNFIVRDYLDTIENAVKSAKTFPLRKIDGIQIYDSELTTISSLNNIRKEKLLFAMLCMAKYQQKWSKCFNGKFIDSITNMFKTARVNISRDDKYQMLHDLYELGLIGVSYKADGAETYVNFVSDGENDSVNDEVGVLTENDYKELAYTYLNWKNHGGYVKCKNDECGRLFKKKGNYELCPLCRKYQKVEYKTIQCLDCGKDVVVDARNMTKCRCDECQNEDRKRQKREWWGKNKT